MSRFFHALVVVGAAISASACGGQSESHNGGEGATGDAGGSGGTGAGGGANGGSSGGSSTGGSGGSSTGGSGGRSTGGSGGSGATSVTGGTGGVGGGSAGTGGIVLDGGKGGTSATGPFPEPELPTSQWDCATSYMGCVSVLGVTAHQLTGTCPADETFPKSAADCATDEIYTCQLAVSVSGEPLLVNCACWAGADSACVGCSSLNHHNGEPASCTPSLKICGCAYTGILR